MNKKMILLGAVVLIVAGFFVVARNVFATDTTVTADTTLRIMYWGGKVNQHIDATTGEWLTDPDGTSGADLDKLTYCQKWYPNTLSVQDYKLETITTWHNAGNLDTIPSTKMSTQCLQNIPAATLSTIAITTPATKLSYTVGDALSIDGLIVTGTYSDGTPKVETITASDITGFDSSAPAVNQVLTITDGTETTTYTINIVAIPNPTPLAPVITLIGASSITLNLGSIFTDSGVTASDNVDGNITGSVVTVNPVNSSVAGTYLITYNVADKAGKQAPEMTRTVIVAEPTSGSGSGSGSGSESGGGHYVLPGVATLLPPVGQVLGASTEKGVCDIYLSSYIKYGSQNNNSADVKKLQEFLNGELGLSIPVDGNYDTGTFNAVKAFQVKYTSDILAPWASFGMTAKDTADGTGYVYKTTERWINKIECPDQNIPMPDLSNN